MHSSKDMNPEKTPKPKPMLTKLDIPRLREQWFERYDDILGSIPLELPPLREVNHHIPLVDEKM
jgi:hypothetical protein